MGIRDAFKLTWEQAVLRMALLDGIEILPEQRTIIRATDVAGYPLAEFCMLFGEYDTPQLISTRFSPDAMLVPAWLHVWEQRKRLKAEGIISRVIPQKGLLQCTYMKEDFARQFGQ